VNVSASLPARQTAPRPGVASIFCCRGCSRSGTLGQLEEAFGAGSGAGGRAPLEVSGVAGHNGLRPSCVGRGEGQNRTADTAIFSRVLCQLSYLAVYAVQAVVSPALTLDESIFVPKRVGCPAGQPCHPVAEP
jgi:hypothetical protein